MESTAVYFRAQVMQVAERVVDRFGAVARSLQSSLEFVEHGLAMFRGNPGEVAHRERTLVVLQVCREDQVFQRCRRARGAFAICLYCRCSSSFI